ncbi:hypothetical protein GPB36_001015 [Salmonella enterica]|nr:hypothetical protein [Salmonella enterica]EDZ6915268.1 hypothetical protein [Salmonella enterica]EIR5838008.1 hypothetical protein [Salmonella enterica]
MLKMFKVSGYAVNRRGNTTGIHYDVRATSIDKAKQAATTQALADGWKFPRLLRVVMQAPGSAWNKPHDYLSPTR